jgi:hypothetical protein
VITGMIGLPSAHAAPISCKTQFELTEVGVNSATTTVAAESSSLNLSSHFSPALRRPDIHKLVQQTKQLSTGTILLIVVAVFVLAVVLQPFQLGLVRLLEGYWGTSRTAGFLARVSAAPRRRMFAGQLEISMSTEPLRAPPLRTGQRIDHQHRALRDYRRRQRLKAKATAVRLRYPRTPERILPTALGNALRSFEDAAGQRYGLETIPVFRRLYPLMSEPLTKTYAASRLQLDSAAGLCVAFMVITLVSAPPLAQDGWWLAFPASTALLAWVAYRGAIASALLMGKIVTTAFDLHRHDLIRSLHYAPAPDPALEYAFNMRLSRWLSAADPGQAPAPQSMEDDYDHSAYSAAVDRESADGTA